VSSGIVRGRVRIMVDAGDDLEPGEVLVANATDTGWTPFFGCAAAVVTNVGGVMSHAAIVAREFGIPAVVNTVDATRRLKTVNWSRSTAQREQCRSLKNLSTITRMESANCGDGDFETVDQFDRDDSFASVIGSDRLLRSAT
jgi:phosphoenolpyruvate synthase/pyruvate phosphate dikinase